MTTHDTSARLAPNSRRISGKATLTIDRSSVVRYAAQAVTANVTHAERVRSMVGGYRLLRRAGGTGRAGDGIPRETYEDAVVRIDVANAEVRVRGQAVTLTPLEFRLLTAFVRHPDQVLNRDQLLNLVWGDASGVAGEQVKLYVGYLRRKIHAVLGEGDGPIETVRGFGYRWRPGAVEQP